MKHAGAATLQTLAPLLARLRALPGLVERRPGCFYRGSKAFLHFHEDASGTHADVRLAAPEFTRVRVESAQEQAALAALVAEALGAASPAPPAAASARSLRAAPTPAPRRTPPAS